MFTFVFFFFYFLKEDYESNVFKFFMSSLCIFVLSQEVRHFKDKQKQIKRQTKHNYQRKWTKGISNGCFCFRVLINDHCPNMVSEYASDQFWGMGSEHGAEDCSEDRVFTWNVRSVGTGKCSSYKCLELNGTHVLRNTFHFSFQHHTMKLKVSEWVPAVMATLHMKNRTLTLTPPAGSWLTWIPFAFLRHPGTRARWSIIAWAHIRRLYQHLISSMYLDFHFFSILPAQCVNLSFSQYLACTLHPHFLHVQEVDWKL